MSKKWKLTVWGVRGSFSRSSPEYMTYGGNTVCVSLECGRHIVILDAGTGLTQLGRRLTAKQDGRRLDILLSHFHIDHVLGLYSFQPLFNSNMEIHLYGSVGLMQHLETLISPPFWPLRLRDLPAQLVFHELQPGVAFTLDDLSVSVMAGNHPDGSLLYRLESQEMRLTYALDCETDEKIFSALTKFAYGSDLLLWDANFTRADLLPGWGHSTWEQGLELGHAAKIRQVLMTHYNAEYTDEFLHWQEERAGRDNICLFAKEGMVSML